MAEPKFEQDLERLEKVVEALEEGGLSLEDSLKHFEEGIKLAKRCEKALTAAEKKIEILTKSAEGELRAEPFGGDEACPPEEVNGERSSEAPKRGRRPGKSADAEAANAADDEDQDGEPDGDEMLF